MIEGQGMPRQACSRVFVRLLLPAVKNKNVVGKKVQSLVLIRLLKGRPFAARDKLGVEVVESGQNQAAD